MAGRALVARTGPRAVPYRWSELTPQALRPLAGAVTGCHAWAGNPRLSHLAPNGHKLALDAHLLGVH
jgi:hypothetical protein